MLRTLLCTALVMPSVVLAQAERRNPPSQQPVPVSASFEDPRIHDIVKAISASRMEADIRKLVSFGTRHTLSDTMSATRGIGAARRWIFDEFKKISADCNGCLDVQYVSEIVKGNPQSRIRDDLNVVNVVATLRGRTDQGRDRALHANARERAASEVDGVADQRPPARR